MPTDWKDGIIVTLYRGKGPKFECSNYCPITLLSVPGKVFAHVILAGIQPLLDRTRRSQQSGFTRGRSTIDAILALRLLSEIHREFNRPINVVYLDIEAAFDSVDRRALWKALRSRGIPDLLTDPSWKRPPGRPRTKWTDQLRRDNNNVPIATLWRQAIGRGHSRATLRSQPTTR